VKGALFPDIVAFRKAVRHYAIVKGFEFTDLKTDPTRFIAKCAHEGCPWRIHASRVQGQRAIDVQMFLDFLFVVHTKVYCCARPNKLCFHVQIKVLPAEHNCPTTKLVEGKMATQGWVADRLSDWVKKNPHKGTKEAKEKLRVRVWNKVEVFQSLVRYEGCT
jgi:hypothetical protein